MNDTKQYNKELKKISESITKDVRYYGYLILFDSNQLSFKLIYFHNLHNSIYIVNTKERYIIERNFPNFIINNIPFYILISGIPNQVEFKKEVLKLLIIEVIKKFELKEGID